LTRKHHLTQREPVVTKWVKNLQWTPTNPKDNIWIHRSIPNVPDTCQPAYFTTATSCLTFTTTTGGICHTDYLASTIVFASGSTPEDFNSIPYLKALLTCLLNQRGRPQSITTNEFYISRNGNPDDDTLIEKHMEQRKNPRCSYALVKALRTENRIKIRKTARSRPLLINDDFSATDEVDWSKVKIRG